ncbi:hypothetical protein D358_01523 [Enterococcus faecalis RP2S-4]|uniref:Uncharacterized protein n=1 Tax=Enterococcus faecalis RP2S-4 TaxID=1244145 RepID=A0ABC9TLD8_ENTFL|nr:hypothetical protein D358_01523 [Enterococcus faecalis RP2S-4]
MPGVCSLRTQHLKIIKNKLRAKRKKSKSYYWKNLAGRWT